MGAIQEVKSLQSELKVVSECVPSQLIIEKLSEESLPILLSGRNPQLPFASAALTLRLEEKNVLGICIYRKVDTFLETDTVFGVLQTFREPRPLCCH